MRGTKREFFPKMSYPTTSKKASFLSASEKKKQKKIFACKYLCFPFYVLYFMAEWYWARVETIVITGIPSGVVRRSCDLTVHPGTTTFTLIDCGEKEFYIVSLMYAKVQRLRR